MKAVVSETRYVVGVFMKMNMTIPARFNHTDGLIKADTDENGWSWFGDDRRPGGGEVKCIHLDRDNYRDIVFPSL